MEEQLGELVTEPRRELAHRVSGGIEVSLYWTPPDDRTTVEVRDAGRDETLVFAVPPERALEVFYHPFAQLSAPFVELIAVGGA